MNDRKKSTNGSSKKRAPKNTAAASAKKKAPKKTSKSTLASGRAPSSPRVPEPSFEGRPPAAVIANITPRVDDGLRAVKRLVWQDLHVQADIFQDGHDVLAARLRTRLRGQSEWHEAPMRPLDNDRWTGAATFFEPGEFEYVIEAWGERYETWLRDFKKKLAAGENQLPTETEEGARLIETSATLAGKDEETEDALLMRRYAASFRESDSTSATAELAETPELLALMIHWSDRSLSTTSAPLRVTVERERAGFSAWYEFFPRSARGLLDRTSTFRDCLPRLDDAHAMGFDVIYFPPIHPIGVTARKGPGNSVTCSPGDPGSPWAIGSADGGHKSVEPSLGAIEDFEWLVAEAKKRHLEIALDFAINASPDHPWVRDHPEWFFHRPDGTIKYAENPPKKYQDIYPLNFHCEDWRNLWREMLETVLFWAQKEVRIFRVDNPHTKPFAFWEYLIAEVRAVYPDVIFLAEAFTRPKMMQTLGKLGFSQSYTYFTWRRTKHEFIEYLTELTKTGMVDYYRANFWPNTPDILAEPLRNAGPRVFRMRAILAAMLCPNWGIYSGYEFCENQPASPDNEEYLESEKFQYKARDWDNPGNIKDTLTALNRIRHSNSALRDYDNITFCHTGSDDILAWIKATPSRDNIILTVVNLDPEHVHDTDLYLPLEELHLPGNAPLHVDDLLNHGEHYVWGGSRQYIRLDPADKVAHIFRLS